MTFSFSLSFIFILAEGSHGAIFESCLLNISFHAPKPAPALAFNITPYCSVAACGGADIV